MPLSCDVVKIDIFVFIIHDKVCNQFLLYSLFNECFDKVYDYDLRFLIMILKVNTFHNFNFNYFLS